MNYVFIIYLLVSLGVCIQLLLNQWRTSDKFEVSPFGIIFLGMILGLLWPVFTGYGLYKKIKPS